MTFSLFTELAILVGVATGVSFIMRLIRQPLLVGYILSGLLVGPFAFRLLHSGEFFGFFSEIGIAFLLFVVGLNLTPSTIRKFGKVAFIAGLGQVLFTSIVGYWLATLLGFSLVPALYIAVALAFSSTIIIMKLIIDRGEIDSLYAKISIGFLLVQDIIAIALLFAIPLFAQEGFSGQDIAITFGKGLVAIIAMFGSAFYILPRLHNFISRSRELLFLFSIAWGMGFSALFKTIGFSLESGALLAGVALSTIPSREEMSSRLAPLRDFFILLFFILLGAEMAIADIGTIIIPALVLSSLVLIGNPLILMTLMGLLGYKKKTSFKTGLTVAQISEFSFVLIALGMRVGHLEGQILSLVTMVGVITIFGSTYLIIYSDKIYNLLLPILNIFERKKSKNVAYSRNKYDHVLFGADRMGYAFVKALPQKKLLVVDYNPDIISRLKDEGFNAQYGDAEDSEFLETLPLQNVKVVISTVPSLDANILLLNRTKDSHLFIATATDMEDALVLYSHGADYVITPHFIGEEYASSLVSKWHNENHDLEKIRKEHIASLEDRLR